MIQFFCCGWTQSDEFSLDCTSAAIRTSSSLLRFISRLLGLLFLLPFLLLLVLLFQSFMLQSQSARRARGEHTVQTFVQQVSVAVTMAGAVLRMMGNVSVSALTRPKEILKQTKKMIYSKPPRHKISAAQSFFVMSVFAVAMLTPAAWILHHLPEYRQRSRQSPKT